MNPVEAMAEELTTEQAATPEGRKRCAPVFNPRMG
jgi:hypothetical protein